FHAQGKKVVVVLNIGGVIEMASWRNEVDGILLAWQPGQEGGNAMADVLTGKVNPSGKLAVTFPMDYADVPSAKFFPGTPADKPTQVIYQEGIYVGYRYYETFGIKTAYDFGFGLSYTHFSYAPLKLNSHQFDHAISFSEKITNNGKVPGKEVAEVYIHAPAGALSKPIRELKAFAKTRLLEPGASQVLHFELSKNDLTSFDSKLSSWVADPGTYTIEVGSSSSEIRQQANFKLAKFQVVKKVANALAPPFTIPKTFN
ncbi:MAG: glycoside hydrolase family 3 C-terminal domain-containing protein, partial [Chitinophagaceae bacterium]